MAQRLKIRLKRTLRENMEEMVPTLFDEFMAGRPRVVGHPRLKEELHGMRLDGKMLRYVMEIAAEIYGKEFDACYEELKRVVGLMGSIHDCDMQLPVVQEELQKIKAFNLEMKREERIPTLPLSAFIGKHKEKRSTLYHELCGILERWESEGFRSKVIAAMAQTTQVVMR